MSTGISGQHSPPVQQLFDTYNILSKTNQWDKIKRLIAKAMKTEEARQPNVAIKINYILASTQFFTGEITKALTTLCQAETSANFLKYDEFLVRILSFKSTIFRRLASQEKVEKLRQKHITRSYKYAQDALTQYFNLKLNNPQVLGKIYFNLGAITAFDPKSWEKTAKYYVKSIQTFEKVENNAYEVIPTYLKLAKIYLQHKKYNDFDITMAMLSGFQTKFTTLITMKINFLRASYLLDLGKNREEAIKLATGCLETAKKVSIAVETAKCEQLLERCQKMPIVSTYLSSQGDFVRRRRPKAIPIEPQLKSTHSLAKYIVTAASVACCFVAIYLIKHS